jgi:tetratricopeptide (TPR) repeat protein
MKMKTLILALFVAICASGAAAAGGSSSPSPAELRIAGAQKVLQKQPNRYQTYNDLALAYIRRARETGDSSYFEQARLAIASSLQIEPKNFEAQQAQVNLLLVQHQYRPALEQARALNQRMPDAVMIWGYIAEAEAALGDYEQAEEAAQWMMNLRPGNVPAYLTGADLRQDWGDIDGAEEYLSKALQQTPPFENEETAWIMTRMAKLLRQSGRSDTAETLLQKALKTFPDYYLSLEELAEIRLAQHLYPEAVDLMEKRNRNFPNASSQLLAARAYEGAGRSADAAKMYAEFELEARSKISQPDNDDVELIAYYADYAHLPQEALRVARLEMEQSHNVWVLDAYAWALFANGRYAEAGEQMQKALAVGTRDSVLYYHAGAIEAAIGKKLEASRYLQQSLDFNPASEVSETARRAAAQFTARASWE